ncbi:MAG TPA: PEP-CTERM sorting domain-containing protein [Bryobacteraceae bacterium]|nr:PEP-CTERM sorting domain-containing protein [Bryobacteraceae bacterium]
MSLRNSTGVSALVLAAIATALFTPPTAHAGTVTLGPFNGKSNTAVAIDTSTGLYNFISFMNTLTNAGFTPNNGWKFVAGNNLPANSLVVTSDQVAAAYPCPPGLNNGKGTCDGIFSAANGKMNQGVAGESNGFSVTNVNPAANNGRWIQTLQQNLGLLPLDNGGAPGMPNNMDPYYGVFGENNDASNFLDAPSLVSTPGAYYFLATLYYVMGGPNAGTKQNPTVVTVQNGMVWGFVDLNLGVRSPLALKAAIDGDLSSVANLNTALGGGVDLSAELSQAQLQMLDAQIDAQIVPEPGSLTLLGLGLGLLAAGSAQRVQKARARIRVERHSG